MCEMSHIISTTQTANQLNDSVSDDEPFGLDGKQEIKIYLRIREHHAECQQQAINCARCAHCGHHVQVGIHRNDVAAQVHSGILRQ